MKVKGLRRGGAGQRVSGSGLGASSILRSVSNLPDESGRHALTLTLTLMLTLPLTLSLCRPFTDTA